MNRFVIWIRSVGQTDGTSFFPRPNSNFLVYKEGIVGLQLQSFNVTPNSAFRLPHSSMVGVAQLVEPQVVALVVVGSSPITHPIKK